MRTQKLIENHLRSKIVNCENCGNQEAKAAMNESLTEVNRARSIRQEKAISGIKALIQAQAKEEPYDAFVNSVALLELTPHFNSFIDSSTKTSQM